MPSCFKGKQSERRVGFEDINSGASLDPAPFLLRRAIDAAGRCERVFQPVTDSWDLVYKVYKEFTGYGCNALDVSGSREG
jgi:hypothetical protein